MKKRIWILTILATILCIGGCSTKSKEPTKEEQEAMKIEQDRMVEYLYTHYEDIREVEFIEFKKNNVAGSWNASAVINKKIYVGFSIIGKLNTNKDIGFTEHISKNNNQELVEKKTILETEDIENIKVKYYDGGEK